MKRALLKRLGQAASTLFLCMELLAAKPQATIIDTGSTNRAGIRITISETGEATVHERGGETRHVKLSKQLCSEFIKQVKAAQPLDALPARHCMKSASFGSSLFVEFEGGRSPDLSCPVQVDTRATSLQKSAREILHAAETKLSTHSRH